MCIRIFVNAGRRAGIKKKFWGIKTIKTLSFLLNILVYRLLWRRKKNRVSLKNLRNFLIYAKQQKMGTKYRVICLVVMK